VWDTADAYGVPLDEVKIGIDRYIWPMTLADRDLSPHVDRVCHALSLDDERPTFRPVLWSEYRTVNGEVQPVSDKQPTQVWFAGVHANVGGGYPDDGLAYVTLQWMLDEARAQGLWVYPEARRDADSRGNPHGRQYDSRAGLAGYYRYGPRRVDELCNDVDHGVKVDVPKVHRAVINRIERWNVAYAPVSFPTDYVIMDRDGGNPPRLVASPPPAKDDKVARLRDTEKAWNAVVWRRWAYFLMVGLTFILAGLPILDPVVFCNSGSTAITAEGVTCVISFPSAASVSIESNPSSQITWPRFPKPSDGPNCGSSGGSTIPCFLRLRQYCWPGSSSARGQSFNKKSLRGRTMLGGRCGSTRSRKKNPIRLLLRPSCGPCARRWSHLPTAIRPRVSFRFCSWCRFRSYCCLFWCSASPKRSG
jgi:hypothetical protein